MGCGHDYESTPEELEAQRKYREQQAELEKHTIFAFYQFDKLAKPDPAEIGGAFGVKILRDRNGILHWLDTKTWPFHYPFCINILGETRTLQEFNEQVYTGLDRSMMFATVMAYPIGVGIKRHYCLELNPADPMTDLDTILDFFALVQKNFIPSENHVLKFHPTSAKQLEASQSEQFKWPVITSAELFANLEYKCIREGQLSAKYLRIFDKKTFTDQELTDWLNQRTIDDIVVIPTVPADIPIVGAVICQEIIPPLCHVALLCQNRKTPCCFKSGIIDILLNERQLTNQVVSSVIAKQGLSLHYEDARVEPPWDVPAEVPIKRADLTVTSLVDWQHFELRSVGTKAYQFSRIQTHYSQSTMDGTFAIPFYYYHQHISKSLVDVEKMKPDQIQHAINSQQIDQELISSVIHRIKSNNWSAVIFRSSTNCEDLEQFNGAGLYESVPLSGDDLNDRTKVQYAIKQVWASVWSQRAVREREYYKIAHKDVAMAVLVQPYLDNKINSSLAKVLLNGVCITHDVGHHKVKHGFYVNCFPGSDLRATNHYKDATPEEVMLVLGRDEKAVDLRLIQQSNQCSQLLITQHDAETMSRVFGELHTMMLGKPHKMDDTVALDIEFMIVDNAVTGNPRELVVLQARPYQVPINPPYISDYNMQLRLSINLHRYNDEKNYSFRFEYNG